MVKHTEYPVPITDKTVIELRTQQPVSYSQNTPTRVQFSLDSPETSQLIDAMISWRFNDFTYILGTTSCVKWDDGRTFPNINEIKARTDGTWKIKISSSAISIHLNDLEVLNFLTSESQECTDLFNKEFNKIKFFKMTDTFRIVEEKGIDTTGNMPKIITLPI